MGSLEIVLLSCVMEMDYCTGKTNNVTQVDK